MNIIHYSDSLLSVLPPLLAVILAVATRRVILSLSAGILAGAMMAGGGEPLRVLQYLGNLFTSIFRQEGDWNWWNVNILLFLLMLGCLISLMTVSGGTTAFANWAQQHIRTRRQAKLMTGLLVFLFFIDDYFHSLAVGTICRPVTDRYRISRAKLAYLLDSTAAPVCVLMPVSSWGAYIIALIGGILVAHGVNDISAFSAFVQMIPLNFYAVFTLLLVIALVLFQRDVGLMARHEEAALAGQLYDAAKGTPPGATESLVASARGRVLDLALPILILVLSTVYFMISSGAGKLAMTNTPFSLLKAFENTDVGGSLVRGGALALVSAVVLALRLGLTPRRWIQCAGHGVFAMWPAIRILVLAWAIGAVIRDIETGKYLSSLAAVSMPVWLLPAMLFVLAGLMAFATGTSWGTFGIMLPLAGDMVMHAEPQLLLSTLAAVLAGAVFGDHCSPISDTTILSSTGAGCHHIDHVMTQLPYALLVASGALVAYVVYGLCANVWVSYLVAGLWFALLLSLLFAHQRARMAVSA